MTADHTPANAPAPTDPDGTAVDLVRTARDAAPERFDAAFDRLVDGVWKDGAVTGLALAAVPLLVRGLDEVGPYRQGHFAVLLGLLAEAELPATDGEIARAVTAGAEVYLRLLRAAAPGGPAALALAYLLAHVPSAADAVLAVAEEHGTGRADRSLLQRALSAFDPARAVLGRVFPSPAEWGVDEGARTYDAGVTAGLTPGQVRDLWDDDTRTVFGSIGARAWWAVRHGTPQVLEPVPVPTIADVPVPPPGPGAHLFARHAAALRCPHCGGGLDIAGTGAACTGCGTVFPLVNGVINVFAEAGSGGGDDGDFLRRLSEVPTMGLFYEELARPAFLRLCGGNWGGALSVADEDAYIAERVRPVDGPVLDLAAGAGRWTEVLAAAVGADRVIALDVNPSMINVLRGRLPEVPALLAGGDRLPFADASLGAVLCWNALQAFPHHAEAAITEVGRCLRPGGTFTVLTFRRPDDAVQRYFQHCHRFPQHGGGLELFDLDELLGWFARAGLTVREHSGPGTFVLITAVRDGEGAA